MNIWRLLNENDVNIILQGGEKLRGPASAQNFSSLLLIRALVGRNFSTESSKIRKLFIKYRLFSLFKRLLRQTKNLYYF